MNKGQSLISQLYRMQTQGSAKMELDSHYPAKRVIISNDGQIEFNPDASKFVYFSKTEKHHVYYIYTKVLKIIMAEINRSKDLPCVKTLGINNNFRASDFLGGLNYRVIKEVQKFFQEYIPPKYVELVSIKYLNVFSGLFEDCAINNLKKQAQSNVPEVSDKRIFNGAYGINDAWLELLKCCTIESEQSALSLEQFFEFILANSYKYKTTKKSIKPILNNYPQFFEILNLMTSRILENPKFNDKNNINDIKYYIQAIEEYKLYNQKKLKALNKEYFATKRQEFQQDYREVKSNIM